MSKLSKTIPNPTTPDGYLVKEAKATPLGMAHFTGTGPDGTYCTGCAFFAVADRMLHTGTCKKYMALSRRPGIRFNGRQLSCRYYEEKKK
jgi:hypothetical protein